ncbi:hypothetical protein [Micromonospora polyrhachis]|uniref:4-amino-4-deoxy-L-arabinose transferase-like glycosyltransferase n=1 Tax=Micromonospora polyrhachis TaxID=1282883 RepID=A0A7W7WMR7_9ACTN|nr:hypothetical protein [Micromonospora polyrhachis]MBB4956749.1 hypothetical protein [Micromonospora polyrhachis]
MTAQHGRRRARLRLDRPARVALALGLAGLGYRLALLLLTVPGSNSDEATFGLVAMHIAAGRGWPVFLYGQHYMGTFESYLAAPLFLFFEPSWPLLRVPLLFLYAAFVLLMYLLTRRLYSPWLATFTVGLLALGSERVVRDQLTTVGGRPEVKPAVVLLLLLAVALGQHRSRHRRLTCAVFGLVAGLALWNDWLVLPYLAVVGVVLLVGCWRDLLGWSGLLLLGGFLIGLLPLIVDNLTAPPGQDSLSVLRQLSDGESEPATPSERLRGAILTGLPLATGLCPSTGCAPWQAWWGPLYLALLLGAAVLAVVGLRRAGGDRIRYLAQLALLLGAALTVLSYARNTLAATAPLATARYLSVLQISLPAVLWPLWLLARRTWRRGLAQPVGAMATLVLAWVTALMIYATAVFIGDLDTIRGEERDARELATVMRRAGIRHTYGEYWTCNRLIFNTREQIVCSVLGEDLRPGQNRHPPYPEQVDAAPAPAYVFESGGPADTAFRAYLERIAVPARVTEVADYRIYQPAATVRPPG